MPIKTIQKSIAVFLLLAISVVGVPAHAAHRERPVVHPSTRPEGSYTSEQFDPTESSFKSNVLSTSTPPASPTTTVVYVKIASTTAATSTTSAGDTPPAGATATTSASTTASSIFAAPSSENLRGPAPATPSLTTPTETGGSIYAHVNRLTTMQSLTLSELAIACAFLGFFLAEHSMLAKALGRFTNLFEELPMLPLRTRKPANLIPQ